MKTTIYLRTASLPPCMGGWCNIREHCTRYHLESDRLPAERLCEKSNYAAFLPLRPASIFHEIEAEAA